MGIIGAAFVNYLLEIPLLVVWGVGCALAIRNWDTHPKAARLTLVALGIIIIQSLIGVALNTWLPAYLLSRGMSAARMGIVLSIRGGVGTIIAAIAWGLLIAAIFTGRAQSEGTE